MKSYREVYEEVNQLISQKLHLPQHNLTEATAVIDLTADSIQLFELLTTFEQHYRLETTYNEVVNLHTVGDIARYIAKHKYRLTA